MNFICLNALDISVFFEVRARGCGDQIKKYIKLETHILEGRSDPQYQPVLKVDERFFH